MKVLVDRDNKEILGAAILGTGGDEAIHGILDVMYAKSALHRFAAIDADPSDRFGTAADFARRSPTPVRGNAAMTWFGRGQNGGGPTISQRWRRYASLTSSESNDI